ncbi:hypothetical protein IIA79_08400 [bacterium]|nr:hypothetical protein [bacterium]
MMGEFLYQGEEGYCWAKHVEHRGKAGALLFYRNPDTSKLHAVGQRGMQEMYAAVEAVEAVLDDLSFFVFFGAYDPFHAGADVTEFDGELDYGAVRSHIHLGTELDARIKAMWPRLRTVAIFAGERYGGSAEWPLFAEWGVADDKTRVQFSEVHLGIIPGWNGVLNLLLKSDALNARYMAQTGDPVSAEQMLKMGLVQKVVSTPAPPNRRETPGIEWPATWAAHSEVCQRLLLDAALDLATQDATPTRLAGFQLATEEELAAEVQRRTELEPYKELRARIELEAAGIDLEAEPGKMKALAKQVARELAALGKPLAPRAVAAVADFVERWGGFPPQQLLERYAEAGREEADLCADLMDTEHRRIGVGAILSRSPAEKITVFE